MLTLLKNYASLGFWWTLFKLNSLFLRFVYTVAPLSLLQKRINQAFEAEGVKLTCLQDGEQAGKYDKTKYKAEIVVKDKQFFYKVFDASLGVGEAYMVRVKVLCCNSRQGIFETYCKL